MTRKKVFGSNTTDYSLGRMVKLITPYYYEGNCGNKPFDLELMLLIYTLQNLYDLADDATHFEVIDSRAFSDFCNISSSNQVPSGDTIGRFRNILIAADLQETLFQQVVDMLTKRGLILKKGTIVDSSFISAPSSTKNRKKERDPEAHSAQKGNHFGYKTHIGVDEKTGFIETKQRMQILMMSQLWIDFCWVRKKEFTGILGI